MSEQIMRLRTSRCLFDYWNGVRGGRLAPQRFEIEPSSISELLPETFILDCDNVSSYRFRLAGTRICEQLGREFRGANLLDFWSADDREALDSLLNGIISDGSVGVVSFEAVADEERSARFEMTLMPLIHSSRSVNRMLGSITAVEPPYWLGSVPIHHQFINQVDVVFPGGQPYFLQDEDIAEAPVFAHGGGYTVAGDSRRKFRVFEGGRSSNGGSTG